MAEPVMPDDADEKWEGYPGHTRAKHELLIYYLDIWLKKLGHPNAKMRIFDCFAGRGEYYPTSGDDPLEIKNIESPAEIPGSPQLLLDIAVERSDNIGEIECIFIEKEPKNANILRNNLPSSDFLPDNVAYEVVEGKFQEETKKFVDNTCNQAIPSFFFMDPFGYKALDYDVVTQLSKQEKAEIFANLMASEVVRWQDAEKHHSALEKLFGTENWHSELESHEVESWNDKEVSYYCQRLRENGPEHTLAYLVTEENTQAMKYYLVFGTDSRHGVEKMHDSMQNCGQGEYAYAPKRPQRHKEQTGLDSFTRNSKKETLKKKLLSDFSDKSLTFDDLVMDYIAEADQPSSQRKHIRSATKELENEQKITVDRVTSSTERGLGGNDILKFP